ncbi:somatomedin-B and thrombospondin type-1 domain-containing protein-like [Pan paniscus]|uniref:somatomedin-B and thrombospondin type-1 domain-containing protein-like n=1 Tax=Pan paniscus TaxID=9597 RepID=UPI00156064E9|nr:somatomedin-B and thrombospondin type-1 domain-containing protein-like [Pan paniscus]
MGMRGVARILSLSLVLAAVATGAWERGPLGVLLPWQGSAALGRCCPGRDPMFVARGPPRCFCDQACGAARDCCADYKRVCPGAPGESGLLHCGTVEWLQSLCETCQVSYRVHRRRVLQEPRNGGVPFPLLEERAGCVEYWSHQGVECQQSLLPALITTGSYGKEWEK